MILIDRERTVPSGTIVTFLGGDWLKTSPSGDFASSGSVEKFCLTGTASVMDFAVADGKDGSAIEAVTVLVSDAPVPDPSLTCSVKSVARRLRRI